MKTWQEITNNTSFTNLTHSERFEFRQKYFDTVIKPQIDESDYQYAQNSFFNATNDAVGGFNAAAYNAIDAHYASLGQADVTTEKEQGMFGDFVDSVQEGMYRGGAGFGETIEQLFGVGEGFRDKMTELADAQEDTMSQAWREAKNRELISEDEDGKLIWGDGAGDVRTWLAQFGNMAGQMADMLIPGMAIGKGARMAAGTVAAKRAAKDAQKFADEAGEELPGWLKEAGKKLARKELDDKYKTAINITAFGAMEGALAGGQAGIQAREMVFGLTEEKKQQSGFYQDLLNQHNGDSELATIELAETVATTVQADPLMISTNVFMGAFGGYALERMLRGTFAKSRLRGATKGFAIQGLTEAPQGGVEQYTINKILQEKADPTQQRWQGVKAAAATEGLMGGGVGMVGGALSRPQPKNTLDQIRDKIAGDIDNVKAQEGGLLDVAPEDINLVPETPIAQAVINETYPGDLVQSAPESDILSPVQTDTTEQSTPDDIISSIEATEKEYHEILNNEGIEAASSFLNNALSDEIIQSKYDEKYLEEQTKDVELNEEGGVYLELMERAKQASPGKYEKVIDELIDNESDMLTVSTQMQKIIDEGKNEQQTKTQEHTTISSKKRAFKTNKLAQATKQAEIKSENESEILITGRLSDIKKSLNKADIPNKFSMRDSAYKIPIKHKERTLQALGIITPDVDKKLINKVANEAATSVENNRLEPTEKQKEVGNYKTGNIPNELIGGLDVKIENPKGSTRFKIDIEELKTLAEHNKSIASVLEDLNDSKKIPSAFKKLNVLSKSIPALKPIVNKGWHNEMKSHYGKFTGTIGADGNAVDVFLGENAHDETLPAFIIDQTNKDGSFDETKVMVGFTDEVAARQGYLENYDKNWDGLGAISEVTQAELQNWLKSGNTRTQYQTDRREEGKNRQERREDDSKRKRVSEMTESEKEQALLTNEKSNLKNERAYIESEKLTYQSFFDIDDFKQINDKYTYDGADEILKVFGDVIRSSDITGISSYHLHGDEFIIQSDSEADLKRFSETARKEFYNKNITIELPDGITKTATNIGVSYGIAKTKEQAEKNLKRDKMARADAGIRTERGAEPGGLSKSITKGVQNKENEVAALLLDKGGNFSNFTGRQNASTRQQLMQLMTGEKVPVIKAGINNLKNTFIDYADINTDGKTLGDIDAAIREWSSNVIEQKNKKPTTEQVKKTIGESEIAKRGKAQEKAMQDKAEATRKVVDEKLAEDMPSPQEHVKEAAQTKDVNEEIVNTILSDASVIGKDRLDAITKYRDGTYTIDDLKAAYPIDGTVIKQEKAEVLPKDIDELKTSKLFKWEKDRQAGIWHGEFKETPDGNIMRYGEVVDRSIRDNIVTGVNRYESSDGEMFDSSSLAQFHEEKTNITPRLIKDGYLELKTTKETTEQKEAVKKFNNTVGRIGQLRDKSKLLNNDIGDVDTYTHVMNLLDGTAKALQNKIASYESLVDGRGIASVYSHLMTMRRDIATGRVNRNWIPQKPEKVDDLKAAYPIDVISRFRDGTYSLDDLRSTYPAESTGIEFDSLGHVESSVRSAIHNPKIRQAIVSIVPVDVMNDLIGSKRSTEEILHDPSMLTDALTVNGYLSVPAFRFFDYLTKHLASDRAKVILSEAGLSWNDLKLFSAISTGNTDFLREARSIAFDGAERTGSDLGSISLPEEADTTGVTGDADLSGEEIGTTLSGAKVDSISDLGRDSGKGITAVVAGNNRHKGDYIPDMVGVKIGGARKDVWSGFREKIGEKLSNDEIVNLPLSKSFPESDYGALSKGGADDLSLAIIKTMRDRVPPKGRRNYINSRYSDAVKALRDTANNLINKEGLAEEFIKKLPDNDPELSEHVNLMIELGFPHSGIDLKGLTLKKVHFSLFEGKENVFKWVVDATAKSRISLGGMGGQIVAVDSREEAIKALKSYLDKESKKPKGKRVTKFEVYRYRDKKKAKGWVVGKKIGRNYVDLADGFDFSSKAREYVNLNQHELEEKLIKFKEVPAHRKDVNEIRLGEDYRGGKDITLDDFRETFGFRGVEFGNWVQQRKRQEDINEAYDGLMDMAKLLDIPPQALSLNGELGMAFGARGIGGKRAAKAHYEPDKVVINLTKKDGAGSLAHEFWHSLDNYFSRMRGDKTAYVTERPVSTANKAIRAEMLDKFKDIAAAIRETDLPKRATVLDGKRTKDYWGTMREMSARSFESYIISKLKEKELSNDYLANIVSPQYWQASEALGMEEKDSYPYVLEQELESINNAYDAFFSEIKTKETDKGVAMFSKETAEPVDTRPALSLNTIKSVVNKIVTANDGDISRVVIVSDFSALPDKIQAEALKQGSDGSDIRGVFDNGKIYIVQSNITSEAEVELVMFHEASHGGFETMLKNSDVNKAINKLVIGIGGTRGITKIAAEAGVDLSDYQQGVAGKNKDGTPRYTKQQQVYILLNELIAHIGEKGSVGLKLKAHELLGAIRTWLRKNGYMKLSALSVSDITYLAGKSRQVGLRKSEKGETSGISLFSMSDIQSMPPGSDTVTQQQSLFSRITPLRENSELVNLFIDSYEVATSGFKQQRWGLLTTRQVTEVISKYLPNVREKYKPEVERMAVTRNQWKDIAGKLAERRRGFSRKRSDQLSDIQHDATIDGIDPSIKSMATIDIEEINKKIKTKQQEQAGLNKNSVEQVVIQKQIEEYKNLIEKETNRKKVYPALKARWNALDNEQQQQFKDERDYHKNMFDAQYLAIKQRIIDTSENEEMRKVLLDRLEIEFGYNQIKTPYFPLSRFGDYFVHSKDESGVEAFNMFTSEASKRRFIKQIEAQGIEVLGHGLSMKDYNKISEIDTSFLVDVDDKINKLGDDPAAKEIRLGIYQLYLQSLPGISSRKHQIHRKNRKGYHHDQLQAFADAANHGANRLARMKHGHLIRAELDKAQKILDVASSQNQMDRLTEEISELQDSLTNEELSKDILNKTQQKIEELQHVADNAKIIKEKDKVDYLAPAVSELRSSYNAMLNPQTSNIAISLNSLGFVWFLGASISSAVVNLFQTPVIAYPILSAKFGYGVSTKAFNSAYADFVKGKFTVKDQLKNKGESRAYDYWHDTGLLTTTLAHDLAGIAEDGIDTGSFKNKFMRTVSFMFHQAEVMNREVTALATYRAAIIKGKTELEAMEIANELTWDTHLDYNIENRARFMRGNFMRVITQFKQYSQGITYLYAKKIHEAFKGESKETQKEARKALYGMITGQMLVAGGLGLPMVSLIIGITQTLEDVFGDDDDPVEIKAEIRAFLADFMGNTAGHFVAKGAFDSLTPFGIHGRLSVSDLWLRPSSMDLEGRAKSYHLMKSLLGPMASIFEGAIVGSDLIAQGEVQRGIEKMLPKVFKDIVKAGRFYTEDAKTMSGRVIKEMNPWESLAQLTGFANAELSDIYSSNIAIMNVKKKRAQRRSNLIDALIQASEDNDSRAINDAYKAIKEWNSKQTGAPITNDTIRSRRRGVVRRTKEMTRGVFVHKGDRDLLARYDY